MTADQQDATATATAATPLQLARAWAARVYQIAQHWEQAEADEPGFGMLQAHIHGAGKQQFEAAQMAAYMATVSIADDLNAMREMLGAVLGDLLAMPPGDEVPGEEGKGQGS